MHLKTRLCRVVNSREEEFLVDNSNHRAGAFADRRLTVVALQQWLGVLPEWRSGPGSTRSRCSAADGALVII